MRRRLALLVAATTSVVLLAFTLGLFTRITSVLSSLSPDSYTRVISLADVRAARLRDIAEVIGAKQAGHR